MCAEKNIAEEDGKQVRQRRFTLWFSRVLIGVVFFFNVECALAFLAAPHSYAPAFELAGEPGIGMVRGMGILFLMWNVPYAFALWNPLRFKVSLLSAVIMQAIGAAGETILLLTFPPGYALLKASVLRFIIFDTAGLVLLVFAGILVCRISPKRG